MSPEARERSFDELARGLASGSISRGKALRLMGAALVGGLLASVPGIAQADPFRCIPGTVKCRGTKFCCPEGSTCCATREADNCCIGDFVCCRFGGPATNRQNCQPSAAQCEALGGHVEKH